MYSEYERHWHGCGHHFIGRHRGRHGFGHFVSNFMEGGGPGGRGFRTGRKLGSGDLQLIILALLAEQPRHGYDIIKALGERSGGFYSPSPGMVYPALTYLEEIGFASVESEGAKKLYRVTDAGRAHLEENRELADSMLSQLERIGRKMERVQRAFAGDDADSEDARRMAGELWRARRELRSALRDKSDAPDDEQRRIAEILKRAAQEIRGN